MKAKQVQGVVKGAMVWGWWSVCVLAVVAGWSVGQVVKGLWKLGVWGWPKLVAGYQLAAPVVGRVMGELVDGLVSVTRGGVVRLVEGVSVVHSAEWLAELGRVAEVGLVVGRGAVVVMGGLVKGGRVVAPYAVMVLAGLAGAAVAGAVIAVMVLGAVVVLGVAVVLVYAMALGQVVVAAVELYQWMVPVVCDGAEWLAGQLVRGWIVAQPSLRVACLVITLITVKPVVDSRIQEFPTHGVVGQQSTIVD